jgi:hypothetical protein
MAITVPRFAWLKAGMIGLMQGKWQESLSME